MAEIVYPSSLPCPQTSTVTPAERRAMSDPQRPREARALQRDRLSFERITWPPMTAEQSDALLTWWRETLVYGGAWFAADWPLPRGHVTAVRKLREQPTWEYVAGGFWRLSALCEVRGVGELPSAGPPVPVDPFWEDVRLLALNGRNDADDETLYETPDTLNGAVVVADAELQVGPLDTSPEAGNAQWTGSNLMRLTGEAFTHECLVTMGSIINLGEVMTTILSWVLPYAQDEIRVGIINSSRMLNLQWMVAGSGTYSSSGPLVALSADVETHIGIVVPSGSPAIRVYVGGVLRYTTVGLGWSVGVSPTSSVYGGAQSNSFGFANISFKVRGVRSTAAERYTGSSFDVPTYPYPMGPL